MSDYGRMYPVMAHAGTVRLSINDLIIRKIDKEEPMIDVSKIKPGDTVTAEFPHPRGRLTVTGAAYTRLDQLWLGPWVIDAPGVKIVSHTPKPWAPPEGWQDWDGVVVRNTDNPGRTVILRDWGESTDWLPVGDHEEWVPAVEIERRFAGRPWSEIKIVDHG